MQAQASLGVWEFLVFWIFTGSGLLGLPPGERDPLLLKSVPAQSLVFFEWASQGKGQSGGTGVDGFVADPEIRQFFELLDTALAKRDISDDEEPLHELRSEFPRLIKLIATHPGCLFVGFEAKTQDKTGVEGWLNALLGLQGGVILSLGEDVDATWISLNRCLTSIPDFNSAEAAPTQSIPLPFPGYQLVMHREGTRISSRGVMVL